jgi:hypothetical protein
LSFASGEGEPQAVSALLHRAGITHCHDDQHWQVIAPVMHTADEEWQRTRDHAEESRKECIFPTRFTT